MRVTVAGMRTGPPSKARFEVVLWWAVTLLTLVVLDDLTFGPAFWVVSRTAGPLWAVFAVYIIYVPVQIFLVYRGTTDTPGGVATWFLRRLDLDRRSAQVQRNEEQIHKKVVGGIPALLFSPVIGGVLPPLILSRRGYPVRYVRRLCLPTAFLYATTFALMHGLLPSLV